MQAGNGGPAAVLSLTSSWARSVGYAYRNTTVVAANPNSSCTPGRVASAQCQEISSETPSALLIPSAEAMHAFVASVTQKHQVTRRSASKPASAIDNTRRCSVANVGFDGGKDGAGGQGYANFGRMKYISYVCVFICCRKQRAELGGAVYRIFACFSRLFFLQVLSPQLSPIEPRKVAGLITPQAMHAVVTV